MTGNSAAIAQQLLDAFNAADWDRFRALLSQDIVYAETGTGRQIDGHDAYLELLQGWRQAMPDLLGTTRRVVANDDTVAQDVTWTGTHSGPLETPTGTIPATGRAVEASATLWYTLRDGKVTDVIHHLDVLTLLGQIGALPGA